MDKVNLLKRVVRTSYRRFHLSHVHGSRSLQQDPSLYAIMQVQEDTVARPMTVNPTPTNSSNTEWLRQVLMMYTATGLVLASTLLEQNENDSSMARCESLSTTKTKKKCLSRSNQDDEAAHENHARRRRSRRNFFEQDYEATNVVGAGSCGVVMQGIDKKDGHVVAVKMIQDLYDNVEEIQREKEALEQLQLTGGHENIITYKSAYHHDGFHYIVTEFVPGESLYALLKKTKRLPEQIALDMMNQLASAVAFLKQNELLHRDLKPENIMIVKNPQMPGRLQVKLIDFGSAEMICSPVNQERQDHQKNMSGTRCYWPPEALLKGETTCATDMWSLGCILYILLSGQHPFDLSGHSSEEEIIQRICTTQVSFENPIWTQYDPEIKELVSHLLEKNPHQRMTVEELMGHPLLQACEL